MDPATAALVIPALLKVGGSAIDSAFAPSPYQPRKSFAGTSADPVTGLTQFQNTLRQILGGTIDHLNAGVDLPDAKVGTLPTFTGGGLPGPIGVTSAAGSGQGNLTQGYHLPGQVGTGDTPTPLGGTVPVSGNVPPPPTWTQPGGDPSAPPLTHPPIAKDPAIGFVPTPNPTPPPTLTGSTSGPAGSQLLQLDQHTQGALQLLFHAAAMSAQGQGQQQPQPGAGA